MTWRLVFLLASAAYFIFSVVYLVNYGLDRPRQAIWVGLIGMVVMAVGLMFVTRKKK